MQRRNNTNTLAAGLIVLIFQVVGMQSASAKAYQSIESIRDAARQFVVGELGDPQRNVKISVGRLDPRLRLELCGDSLEVFLSPGGGLDGHTTVGVRCSAQNPWSLFVPVHVQRFLEVVVAAEHIARGELVSPQAVKLERRSSERIRNNHARQLHDVVGQIASRAIPRGSMISANAVKAQRLVKRGDRVTLSMQSGAIAVRTAGIALGDGTRGDRIKVRNLSSKRVLDGVVHGSNLVVIGNRDLDPAATGRVARKF